MSARTGALPEHWFHGTDSDAIFRPDQEWDRSLAVHGPNTSGPGLYFTADPAEAAVYGRRNVWTPRAVAARELAPG